MSRKRKTYMADFKTKEKILLVIPTLNQGGAERVISELTNYWSKSGLEIHLAILVKSYKFYNIDENVIMHEIGGEITNKISKIFSIFKTYFKLRELIKENSFNFILSFLPQSNVLTIFSSIGLGQRVYISERNSPTTWNDHSRIFTYIKFFLYRFSTGFIAQTNDAKTVLKRMYPNKNVKVIPNPIKYINNDNTIEKENIILNVGRLDKQKGQLHLIKAFKNIRDHDWILVILGEGPLREELEQEVEKLGLSNRVKLPGSVINIDEWYMKSSIFAFPSLYEGFPNALAEAMASGLPCVSYDCDTGPREFIINNKNGFLIPVGQIGEFSKCLNSLILDKKKRDIISVEAKKIISKYDIENISNMFLDFCKK